MTATTGSGWFGVVVKFSIGHTSTKLTYIEQRWYCIVTFGGCTIPVFIQATQAHSLWSALCSTIDGMSTDWWRFYVACYQNYYQHITGFNPVIEKCLAENSGHFQEFHISHNRNQLGNLAILKSSYHLINITSLYWNHIYIPCKYVIWLGSQKLSVNCNTLNGHFHAILLKN